MNRLKLVAATIGHAVTDAYMGFLPGLYEILRRELRLENSDIGTLVVVAAVAGGLLQPLFGYIADRVRTNLFVVLGPVIAAIGICALGSTHSLALVAFCIALGSLGNGAFHPSGAALAGESWPQRRAGGVAIFSSLGIVGYAAGPIIAASIYTHRGLPGLWLALPIGVVTSVALGWGVLRGRSARRAVAEAAQSSAQKAPPPPLRLLPISALFVVVLLRSTVVMSFHSSISGFLQNERGLSVQQGADGAALLVFAGGLCGLLGGMAVHRCGERFLNVVSLLAAGPLLYAFLRAEGMVQWVSLGLGGALLQCTASVNIAQAQRVMPGRANVASALMMGTAWALASFGYKLFVAPVADRAGFGAALVPIALLPTVAGLVSLWPLPDVEAEVARAAPRALLPAPDPLSTEGPEDD